MLTSVEKKISPSEMNLFYFCPEKWNFTELESVGNIQGIPVDEANMEYGKVVHMTVASYYRGTPKIPVDKIPIVVRSLFENSPDRKLLERFGKRTESVIANLIKFEVWRSKFIQKLDHVRPIVEDKMEHNGWVGVVDVYFPDIGLGVDWKTSSYDEMSQEIMRQGSVYLILLKSRGYDVKKFIFSFLVTGRMLELPRTTDGWVMNERRKMMDAIANARFAKNRGSHCSYCRFQLDCYFEGCSLWDDILQ